MQGITARNPRATMNPLEPSVAAIEENRNYLTAELVKRLRALLPEELEADNGATDTSLEGMLERLGRMVRLLELQTQKEGTSPAELKSAVAAAKDLFNLVAKYGQSISAEKKTEILKRTVIDILSEFSKEAKEKFIRLWEERVRKAAAE